MITFLADYLRLDLHGLLNLGAGIFNISAGLIILSKNPKSRINISFFTTTFTALMWVVGLGMASLVFKSTDAWMWVSISYLGGVPFISPSVYFFSSTWRGLKNDNKRIVLGYILAFIFMLPMLIKPELILNLKEHTWGRYVEYQTTAIARTYSTLLLTFFFSYALMAFSNFYWGWKHSVSPSEKRQFLMVLIAYMIGYTGSIDFAIAFGLPIYAYGYISLTILIAIITTTIIRYQFLGINLLFRRLSTVFLIYSFLLAFIIPIVIVSLTKVAPLNHLQLLIILSIVLLLGIALSIGPVIYAFLLKNIFWLKGQISTGLAHELKSPLGAIQGALQQVQEQLDGGNMDKQKLDEYVDMIHRHTLRLESFTNNLLQIPKIQEGTLLADKKLTDLSQIINKVIHHLKLNAEQKGLKVHTRLNWDGMLELDEAKMEQAISNILLNAIKFTKDGTILVEMESHKDKIVVSIKDEGMGLAKEDLNRIFERFYQAKKTSQGSGIGLTIAKAWVEAHGGKIWAESEGEGKGTRITFTLPIT